MALDALFEPLRLRHLTLRNRFVLFDGEAAWPMPLDGLVRRLEAGEFDLVAVGRALLADPQWVRKVRDGSYARIEPFDKTKFDTVY